MKGINSRNTRKDPYRTVDDFFIPREADGSVKQLSRHHVDTGMGLERMATILQQVPSNYDTDLFQPIIKAIEKVIFMK